MDTNNNKIRKHRSQGIPIIGPLAGSILVFIFMEMIMGGFIGGVVDNAFLGGKTIATYYFAAFSGILVLLVFKLLYRGKYKGFIAGKNFDRQLIILIAIAIVVDLISIIYGYITTGVRIPTVVILGQALTAGVCEEIAFRVIPISLCMRKPENKKCIVVAIVMSSVSFGVIHAANIFAGMSDVGAIVQIIFAIAFGVFTGAIYLRTGNIIIPMVFHVLHDYLVFLASTAEKLGQTDVTSTIDIIESICLALVFLALGILMIKGHTDGIIAVWKERWNYSEETESVN